MLRELCTLLGPLASLAAIAPEPAVAAVIQQRRTGPEVKAYLSTGVVKLGGSVQWIVDVEGARNSSIEEVPTVEGLSIGMPIGPQEKVFSSITASGSFTTVSRRWLIPIQPERVGDFVLPGCRLSVEGERVITEEIPLKVVVDMRGEELGFFEIHGQPQRVYEGQPFTIDLAFGWDDSLDIRAARLILPWWGRLPGVLELAGTRTSLTARSVQIGLNTRSLIKVEEVVTTERDGRPYRTFRLNRRFAATRPDTLEFPQSFLEFRQPVPGSRRGIFAQETYEDYYVHLPALTVEVLPIPEEGRPFEWTGAVGTIDVDRRADRYDVDAGDSIKLTVSWFGDANLEFFDPPDPSRIDAFEGFRLLGTKDEYLGEERRVTYDLVPTTPELSEIPGVPLWTFDPELGEYRRVESKALPIRVRALETTDELSAEGDRGPVLDIRDVHAELAVAASLPRLGATVVFASLGLVAALWLTLRRWIRRRHGDPDAPLERRRRGARRRLARQLRAARSAEEQAAALHEFLAARTREPAQAWVGRDPREWAEPLEAAPSREALDGLRDVMRELDERMYGGAGARPLETARILAAADGFLKESPARSREVATGSALRSVIVLGVLLGALVAGPLAAEDGIEAYRAGDYETARNVWMRELELATAPAERARLAYALGNAAYRGGAMLEAVGWYTASLRIAPRNSDAWYNLELARGEAGLPPANKGELSATVGRLLSSLTLVESEWGVLGATLLLAVFLAGEALFGSRMWRNLATAGLLLVLFTSLPWLWNALQARRHPLLVVEAGGTPARSEPAPTAKSLARVAAGEIVERRDALPDWVKVEVQDGRELWVREDAVFDLVR